MTDQPISIGVDIGGSHITCAAVNMRAGRLIPGTENRAAVDHHAAADQILETWSAAIHSTISQIERRELAGVGFAIPGPFNYRAGISKMQHKFIHLYDLPIAARLSEKLPIKPPPPMRFLNDATAFAVGEAWLGMGAGHDRVVAITLGTGFGSAFIDRGVPIARREDVPPEGCLWHLPYGDGLADDHFSTGWFVREYEKASGNRLPDAKTIARAAGQDPVARELFDRFGRNLASFLTPWFRKFRAQRLVVGGNIAKAYDLFGPAFETAVQKEGLATSVALSTLGERAALVGAARLFEPYFWEQVQDQLPSI